MKKILTKLKKYLSLQTERIICVPRKEHQKKKKKECTRQIPVKCHHSKDNDKVSQSPRQEKQVIDTERVRLAVDFYLQL